MTSSERITIKSVDGGTFSAYCAKPDTLPASGIVLIQEIFGVNQVMRDQADQLAAQGYLVVCPDLFWRIEPNIDITDKTEAEWAKAFELFKAFNVDAGVKDLDTTLQHVRDMENCNGKVGSVGFCLGGKLAFLMATRTDADCNVAYYGVGLDELVEEQSGIGTPLLMHMAGKDQFVPPEAQEKIKSSLKENSKVTLHYYADQDHAFARIGGNHYDADAAKAANDRTAAFFKENLG